MKPNQKSSGLTPSITSSTRQCATCKLTYCLCPTKPVHVCHVLQNEKSAGVETEVAASLGAAGITGDAGAGGESAAVDENRRATWLSTRQMEDDFKELVFLAIQEVL